MGMEKKDRFERYLGGRIYEIVVECLRREFWFGWVVGCSNIGERGERVGNLFLFGFVCFVFVKEGGEGDVKFSVYFFVLVILV